MAVPTAPTLVSITTEGLKKAGITTPTSAQLARAQDEWMEEIKNDIWIIAKKLISLQTTTIQTLVNGQSRYSLPTDFSSIITMEILDGRVRGTAQAGSATSITLASADTSTDIIGSEIVITAGTGQNSISRVTAFNTTTKVATVAPSWTAPASGSSYMIIDTTYPLTEKTVVYLRSLGNATNRDVPSWFYTAGDADDGEYELYPIPYQSDSHVMACRITYYADLMELDLAGTLMATLYKKWRNLFTQGVLMKTFQNDNESRAEKAATTYGGMLSSLIMREQYGVDNSNLSCVVKDFRY
mgnify:CR=1 FL=1